MVPVNHNTSHTIYENFLTHEECSHISHVLQRDEERILSIPNNAAHTTPYTGLTNQHIVYNWLNHRDIRPLKIPQRLLELPLFQSYNHLKIQCWGNILRQGEDITLHQHHGDELEDTTLTQRETKYPPYPLVASNIFLDGIEPSYTHYEDTGKTVNVKGDIHIVGSLVRHSVKTNIHRTPRVSLAMDIFYAEFDKVSEWGFFNEKRFLDVYRNNV